MAGRIINESGKVPTAGCEKIWRRKMSFFTNIYMQFHLLLERKSNPFISLPKTEKRAPIWVKGEVPVFKSTMTTKDPQTITSGRGC